MSANALIPDRADSLMSEDQSQKLQLSVSARKLADLDTFTVTDSFLVIRIQQFNRPPRQILRTKVYDNDLNPNYAETAIVQFFFQVRQNITFQIYHQSKPPKLVGRSEVSLGQLFGSPDSATTLVLRDSNMKQSGKLIVRCEKISKSNNQQIQMEIAAESLPSSTGFCSCFGSIDPFFRIIRKDPKQDLLVYESQIRPKSRNPTFTRVNLAQRRLCRQNPNQPFEIKFYNHSSWGNHSQIGSAKIKLSQIENKRGFEITSNGSNNGICLLKDVNRYVKYSFGDYIQAGLQLALVTCIDFTGSNGIPTAPDSLHYMNGARPSEYTQALIEVSKILLDYDYDKLVPIFGFGAKVRMPTFDTHGKVHHCFPLNGDKDNPNVFQVQGLLDAYRKSLPYLQFAGPTLFSGLLGEAIQKCKQFQKDCSQYMVLFILTDGQINDTKQVIDQIISCCKLPISIIIVGIGNGDFGIMNKLDDDDRQLRDSHGNGNIRDLVQFVEFSKFKGSGVQLAKQVLEQLPNQVVQYFKLMNLNPGHIKSQKNDIQRQIETSKILPRW